MADDWIKMRSNLGADPDVIQIAAAVGLDEFSVVGRLHAVWSWLDQHSQDGTNVRIPSAFIDRLADQAGFFEALRAVGWGSGADGALNFPGYGMHNGNTAKRRAVETKRKRQQREREEREAAERDKCPAPNGTNVPQGAGLEKRREDTEDTLNAGAKLDGVEPEAPEGGLTSGRQTPTPEGEPGPFQGETVFPWEKDPQVTAPDLKTVMAVANNRSIPPDCAEAFYNTMMATNWVDNQKRPIRNWPFALNRYAGVWRANEFQRGRGASAPAAPAKAKVRKQQSATPSTLFPKGAPAGVTVNLW